MSLDPIKHKPKVKGTQMLNSPRSVEAVGWLLILSLGAISPHYGQKTTGKQKQRDSRLLQSVEANVIGTHAFQILLAKKSGKGDSSCFVPAKFSDGELETLVAHQAKLLKSDMSAVSNWVRGGVSQFDPAQDLDPLLSSGLKPSPTTPVNVFDSNLQQRTRFGPIKTRAIASLYQTGARGAKTRCWE